MSFFTKWLERAIGRQLRRFDGERGISEAVCAQARLALESTDRFRDRLRLLAFEHRVFSQGGEDGIVREIFRRIGCDRRTFIELGAGDGIENNTAFLLQQGWTGIWCEGDFANVARIRAAFAEELADGKLRLVDRMLRVGSAMELLKAHGDLRDPDLLSIDLDRHTHHFWLALGALNPRVAIIEYNAAWPADLDFAVELDETKAWRGGSHFGASLKALERIGSSLGYSLVGCDAAGTNAFFVRNDLLGGRFREPYTAENHYEPARDFLHARRGHRRAFRD